ncbi:CoA-binding protein [Alkalicoccus daliensis]|uniref:Predicted CoA-binding protein n=1 Tax=Alkalicoccus daliensis TaxID=745820 RepID=A0A1H0AH39_9BACI|nr:CoA-binding protein [Alkalicoccus daliensis]SDN32697.1 Predicted CoA-binding protein [Alkalicoccus daliensis]
MDSKDKKKLLEEAEHIAIVGLSDKPYRTSYQIGEALIQAGYKITPVNPHVKEVFGVKSVDSIKDLGEDVDIINVFRRSEYIYELAEQAVKTNIPAFWAQLGVYDAKAEQLLKEKGKQVVMNSCIKVDHALLVDKNR